MVGSTPLQHTYFELVTDIKLPSISEEQIRVSLDNLIRVGLIKLNDFELKDGSSYSFAKSSELYAEVSKEFEKLNAHERTADRIHIDKKCLSVTPLGNQFHSVCIKGFND